MFPLTLFFPLPVFIITIYHKFSRLSFSSHHLYISLPSPTLPSHFSNSLLPLFLFSPHFLLLTSAITVAPTPAAAPATAAATSTATSISASPATPAGELPTSSPPPSGPQPHPPLGLPLSSPRDETPGAPASSRNPAPVAGARLKVLKSLINASH